VAPGAGSNGRSKGPKASFAGRVADMFDARRVSLEQKGVRAAIPPAKLRPVPFFFCQAETLSVDGSCAAGGNVHHMVGEIAAPAVVPTPGGAVISHVFETVSFNSALSATIENLCHD
jgi:hypothetical protein